MGRNKIAAFDAPADGENPNGFRSLNTHGIGREGMGNGPDRGYEQWNWDNGIAGPRWDGPPAENVGGTLTPTKRRR